MIDIGLDNSPPTSMSFKDGNQGPGRYIRLMGIQEKSSKLSIRNAKKRGPVVPCDPELQMLLRLMRQRSGKRELEILGISLGAPSKKERVRNRRETSSWAKTTRQNTGLRGGDPSLFVGGGNNEIKKNARNPLKRS